MVQSDQEKETNWSEEELGKVELGDRRLNIRLVEIADKLSSQPREPINQACDDWADTKAAYRLVDNEKVSPEKILEPHQKQTQKRMSNYPVVLGQNIAK